MVKKRIIILSTKEYIGSKNKWRKDWLFNDEDYEKVQEEWQSWGTVG